MTDTRYGRVPEPDKNKKPAAYPVADWMYGHRLIIGQHWLEYTLEFLNVMAGYGYELGKGIDTTEGVNGKPYNSDDTLNYVIKSRHGLRRFVFYNDAGARQHPSDRNALERIEAELKQKSLSAVGTQDGDQAVELVRSLLRSFTAVEDGRSWFACSLFPVHDNFLFFEARRVKTNSISTNGISDLAKLDQGLRTSDRNFFARGGEIYYLMLSAGTKDDPNKCARISERIKSLMYTEQSLGSLAELIDNTWGNLVAKKPDEIEKDSRKGKLGWLPGNDCPAYHIIAQDLYNFLSSRIDQQHSIELLSHLVGFHLIQMIYHRANEISGNSFTYVADANATDPFRPRLPIDCSSTTSRRALRDISSAHLKAHGDNQLQAVRQYILNTVNDWSTQLFSGFNGLNQLQLEMALGKLKEMALEHFNLEALKGNQKKEFEDQFALLKTGKYPLNETINKFVQALTEPQLERFRKSVAGVHTKLGKGIGFIMPKSGRGAHYVLGPTLLKALVVANIEPDNSGLEFTDFVKILYERYGLVIGPVQAKQAGLIGPQATQAGIRDIDRQFYKDNEQAFRQQLRYAGLLKEYSDATAIVINPFAAWED